MISSEVQRTLVKSPPELWAELGDPISLARHLGELGEIRITRTEPEKLVEWEAESAKGTVAMKGSGWGTKVTLTASRELSPPHPAPGPEDDPAIDNQPSSSGEEIPTATERRTDEPEALDQTSTLGQQPSSIDQEPAPSGLDAWSRQQADLAVTAAERFSFEHPATLLGTDLQRATEPPIELDDENTVAEPSASPDPLQAASSGATTEPDPKQPPEAQEPTEAQEPRRGLFARLFGFGRKRSSEPAPSTAIPIEAPASVAADATPDEPADTIPTVADTDPERAVATNEPESGTMGTTESSEAAEVGAPTELEIPAAALDEAETAQPTAETHPATSDLADELRAAEEEVEAILTGILDRLGAAHHRPFSRS